MPDVQQFTHYFAYSGANSALDPEQVSSSGYVNATNVQIKDGLPTTRMGSRVVPFRDVEGNEITDDQALLSGNGQGFDVFNPAKGQSGQVFASDLSRIMSAVCGRKYEIQLNGNSTNTCATVIDQTNDIVSDPQWHIVYWAFGENYAFAGDGNGDLWQWDSLSPATVSPGYNIQNPANSFLPNGSTNMIYAHGRMCSVVNSRQIIVGNSIHGNNLTRPIDMLKTSQQIYWDSGQYFVPPSSMGNILAVGVLPQRDTSHGHGDIMWHTQDGVFSLNINVAPRAEWETQSLVRHFLLDTGAAGPYALDIYDGDQIFRSKYGVQTLRSASAESQLIGDPYKPISDQIKDILDTDYEPWLKFASLKKWNKARKSVQHFFTTRRRPIPLAQGFSCNEPCSA